MTIRRIKGRAIITVTPLCGAVEMKAKQDGGWVFEGCKLPACHDGDHIFRVIDTTARKKDTADDGI